jgi:hypothetical protein
MNIFLDSYSVFLLAFLLASSLAGFGKLASGQVRQAAGRARPR